MPQDAPSQERSARWVRWLVRIAIATAALYLVIGAVVLLRMTRPKRVFKPEHNPASRSLPYEEVRFSARGGDAEIAAWFVPAAAAKRAVILVHGKDSNRSRFMEHSGDIAVELHRRALSLLLIDLRGHGQSSPARLSFGLKEHRDILGAVDWLSSRGYKSGHIGVLGQSMGGASTLYAVAAEPAIAAAVTDCAYGDIAPVIDRQFQHSTGLPNWFQPATRLFGWLLIGVDLAAAKPLKVVPQIAPRPLLLIHSGEDALVPVGQAADLRLAIESSQLWVVAGARHVYGIKVDPAGYQAQVGSFFQRSLPAD